MDSASTLTPEELAREALRLEEDTKGIQSAVKRWERDQKADAFHADHCPTIAQAYLDALKEIAGLRLFIEVIGEEVTYESWKNSLESS